MRENRHFHIHFWVVLLLLLIVWHPLLASSWSCTEFISSIMVRHHRVAMQPDLLGHRQHGHLQLPARLAARRRQTKVHRSATTNVQLERYLLGQHARQREGGNGGALFTVHVISSLIKDIASILIKIIRFSHSVSRKRPAIDTNYSNITPGQFIILRRLMHFMILLVENGMN